MKEIIFDLLLVGKSYKTVFFPEVIISLLLTLCFYHLVARLRLLLAIFLVRHIEQAVSIDTEMWF